MYKSKVIWATKELSKAESVKFVLNVNAKPLDEIIKNDNDVLDIPFNYAVIVHVNNDQTDVGEYDRCYIVDDKENIYSTSSNSFMNSLQSICDIMETEQFILKCFKIPSRNYKDKFILTCNL